ncbi:MAG TPA: DoxX family protein [Myxococcaceae bacterium]|nr:DoxX family protein [Myxococcaceae bacterium]
MTASYASIQHPPSRPNPDVRAVPDVPASSLSETPSRKALWTGRTLSGLFTLFMAFDAGIKLLQHPEALKGTSELGYPVSVVFGIGVVQAVCLIVYLVPRTSILGAVLWTGYLGGAVATHVRVGNSLFGHVLFPLYVAALLWGGLWLRDLRLRALLPLRTSR